nr:hypothetical protein KPHV_57090 [Kitasatospora purpeofusca]
MAAATAAAVSGRPASKARITPTGPATAASRAAAATTALVRTSDRRLGPPSGLVVSVIGAVSSAEVGRMRDRPADVVERLRAVFRFTQSADHIHSDDVLNR